MLCSHLFFVIVCGSTVSVQTGSYILHHTYDGASKNAVKGCSAKMHLFKRRCLRALISSLSFRSWCDTITTFEISATEMWFVLFVLYNVSNSNNNVSWIIFQTQTIIGFVNMFSSYVNVWSMVFSTCVLVYNAVFFMHTNILFWKKKQCVLLLQFKSWEPLHIQHQYKLYRLQMLSNSSNAAHCVRRPVPASQHCCLSSLQLTKRNIWRACFWLMSFLPTWWGSPCNNTDPEEIVSAKPSHGVSESALLLYRMSCTKCQTCLTSYHQTGGMPCHQTLGCSCQLQKSEVHVHLCCASDHTDQYWCEAVLNAGWSWRTWKLTSHIKSGFSCEQYPTAISQRDLCKINVFFSLVSTNCVLLVFIKSCSHQDSKQLCESGVESV